MYVKCKVMGAEDKITEMVLNTAMIIFVQPIEEENKVVLAMTTGMFTFTLTDQAACVEVYSAFINMVATNETTLSNNISLFTL